MTVGRVLGVDVDALASDAAVLGTAGEALGERWVQVLALRSRTQGLGLSEVGGDDPLAVMAGLPERLRADLDVLDGIREAAEAAWHGVAAVCSRLARLADDTVGGLEGVFADPDADATADDALVDSGSEHPAAGYARAGLSRIDRLLGELDGGPEADLVLIGGR